MTTNTAPDRPVPGNGNRPLSEVTRETRLRNTAKRQGLTLRRSRRRDPLALDFNKYFLTRPNDPQGAPEGSHVAGSHFGITLDEVETYLLNPNK